MANMILNDNKYYENGETLVRRPNGDIVIYRSVIKRVFWHEHDGKRTVRVEIEKTVLRTIKGFRSFAP